MIDIAWKALSAAPTRGRSQWQSCSALKHQTYLIVLTFIILISDFFPGPETASFTFVKADQPVHCKLSPKDRHNLLSFTPICK